MFAKTIVLSDSFLDLPMSSRCLYFTLGMLSDDDGFVNSPKSIMRQIGASQDDLINLMQRKFIIGFDSGIIVIKHWRINNYLRNDRYTETKYLEEKSMLNIEENGAYTEVGIPMVYPGKDSIDKNSIDKNSIEREEKPTRHKYGEYSNILLTDDEFSAWQAECPMWKDYIEKMSAYVAQNGKTYKNYLAALRTWYRKDEERKPAQKQVSAPSPKTSYDLEAYEQSAMQGKLVYHKRK